MNIWFALILIFVAFIIGYILSAMLSTGAHQDLIIDKYTYDKNNLRKTSIAFKRYCDAREKDGYIGSNETLWEDFIQELYVVE